MGPDWTKLNPAQQAVVRQAIDRCKAIGAWPQACKAHLYWL
jgi:hypothetical protein